MTGVQTCALPIWVLVNGDIFWLTMEDFIVSTVRSITCFFAFELVNVDVATLSKFNFPYLRVFFF